MKNVVILLLALFAIASTLAMAGAYNLRIERKRTRIDTGEPYTDIEIDIDDIHIKINYDPNDNVFVCEGATTAQEVLRVMCAVLCDTWGLRIYDINNALTASFVFDEPKDEQVSKSNE